MKHIKDPIHQYIDIPEEELSIMNTSEFQRLRRIKQLGFSSTVYPSATHTRFAHSLGVMYLAGELADSINLSEEEVRTNQVAGLLHDVGHLPFSHTLEHLLQEETGLTHEDISCQYIDEIADKDSVNFPVPKENVKAIIKGEYDSTNLVANEIDADRLDYLLRDSYHTGIDLGQIEEATLIKFARNVDGDLGFDHKSLKSVERLLDARMQMNYSVYSHDTVNITETMLERAVKHYINDTDNNMMNLVGMGDGELSVELTSSDSVGSRDLFTCVRDRDLYKSAYFDSLHDLEWDDMKVISDILENVDKHEQNIADMAGVEDYEVLMSPPQISDVKTFETPIIMPTGDVRHLQDVSPKPDSLRESMLIHENLNVFTKESLREKVKFATQEYFSTIDSLEDKVESI